MMRGLFAAAVALLEVVFTPTPIAAQWVTVERQPIQTGTEHVPKFRSPPGIWCPNPELGLQSEFWLTAMAGVPWTVIYGHHYLRGRGRRRCRESASHTFLGRAQFDVSPFVGREILQATLVFEVRLWTVPEVDEPRTDSCSGVPARVIMNRHAWLAGFQNREEHAELAESLRFAGTAVATSTEADVTHFVRDWISGNHPNAGVSLLGPDYSNREGLEHCVAFLAPDSIRLRITYTRAP